ncbi:hypothetical protein AB0D34_42230 [Streptomyces sp. NPDC048420]|uniref:hypothetical protein n=1 Tax=Streptomyces sp. NPDC048420 TaxID=3155755 RepID=UPI00343C5785
MAAVEVGGDADPFGERFAFLVQLVVDELAVVEDDGLVEAVGLVLGAVPVGQLAAVTRVGVRILAA